MKLPRKTKNKGRLREIYAAMFFTVVVFLTPQSFAQNANPVISGERIDSFVSTLAVQRDASLLVTETIKYNFGTNQKHGIYRDIPVRYHTAPNDFALRLKVISVQDEQGGAYHYTVTKEGAALRIKIGDANLLISGAHTYVITYRVERALLFYKDGNAELYWNVNGNQWTIPIGYVGANVILPQDVAKEKLQLICFSGTFGSTEQNCASHVASGSEINFALATSAASLGRALTIGVRWPKGIVQEPGSVQNGIWFLEDNGMLGLPLLYLFIYGIYWWKRGRDPQGKGTIVPQYEAPDNLSPLEVGVVYEQNADNRDLGAGVIWLAMQGFLKIRLVETKEPSLLGIATHKNWELVRVNEGKRELTEYEKKLLDALELLSLDASPKKLSDLKNGIFYQHISEINDALYESLVLNGYFPRSPKTVRALAIAPGMVPLFLFGFFAAIVKGDINGIAIVSLIASGIIALVFGWLMPHRTVKGRLAYENILGFKEYLSVAEKDRIKFHNPPTRTPEVFEKFLPYAIVLGVEKEWAQQFKDLTIPPPSWYQGGNMAAFNALMFTDALHSTVSSMNSAFTSPPSSGSGGGFGGGGFSGGGFGGGGGGSW